MSAPLNTVSGDFAGQLGRVLDSVEPLLWSINQDPHSPAYGCAHLGFWRDKTSDVADTRRQEALLPLALLYSRQYPGSRYCGDSRLLSAVKALLLFWCRTQYPDGSMDEWYKGERAYAAAAFSVHAVARTLQAVGAELPEDLLELARRKLHRAASWLEGRDDLVKTNHQAVGAAAMAVAGQALHEARFTANARVKLASVLAVQQPEGWFPELGSADPGYVFLTVEYLAMAMQTLGDWAGVEAVAKGYDFAASCLHPDLTLGEEYGICRNPYVSRIATVLLAPHSSLAAYVLQRFLAEDTCFAGAKATLGDELRVSRWAFQPLLSLDFLQNLPQHTPRAPAPIALLAPGEAFRDLGAGLWAHCTGECGVLVAACAGGLVRLFGPGARFADFGYALEGGRARQSTSFYDRRIPAGLAGDVLVVQGHFSPVRPFLPPYWARVALRCACSTALGSRLTRSAIDVIRLRKGTAINQSSGNISSRTGNALERRVQARGRTVTISDLLTFTQPVDTRRLSLVSCAGQDWQALTPLAEMFPALPESAKQLRLQRTYVLEDVWTLSTAVSG